MHVRFPTDRRRVAELRRHETHRERDVSFRLGRALRRTELGQHRRCAQRSTPRAKVFRAVVSDAPLEIRIHITCVQRVPSIVSQVPEERGSRRAELSLDESNQLAIREHLSLPDTSLSLVREARDPIRDVDVRLAQRRDAERSILALIPFAADATERLADHTQNRCRYRVRVERRGTHAGTSVGSQRSADSRQLLRQLSHAMVFAQLAPFDRALVVAVLLSTTRIDAPCLDRGAGRRGDVNVAPRWRNAQDVDAVQAPAIGHGPPPRVDVAKPRRLRAEPTKPRSHAGRNGKSHTGSAARRIGARLAGLRL